MNETASSAVRPWREVLWLEAFSAPTVEKIHEHFLQRVKEADARRRDEVDELNRARSAAIAELWPE